MMGITGFNFLCIIKTQNKLKYKRFFILLSIWTFKKCFELLIVSTFFFCDAVAQLRPNADHGLLILEVSRSHTTTYHSR